MRRVSFILVVVSLLVSASVHLPVLQVVAWSGMIVSYSRTAGLAEAIEMTFDGNHPCPLCKEIRKQQAAPDHELAAPSVPDRQILISEAPAAWSPLLVAICAAAVDRFDRSVAPHRPPVPPPRAIA